MSVNSSAMAVIQQLLAARMLTPGGVTILLDPNIATSTVDTIQRLLEAGMLTLPGLAALLGLDLASLSAPPIPTPAPQVAFPPASQVPPVLPISAPLPLPAHPTPFHAPLIPVLQPPPSTQSMPPPILSLYQSPAQMLQSLGPTNTPSSSLPTGYPPRQSGLSQIAHRLDSRGADRQRCEHAAAIRTEDGEPKRKRKKRSKAVDKPQLEGVDGAKMEDFLQKATGVNGEVESVMNVSLQGRLPFPDRDTCKVFSLFCSITIA